MRAGPPPCASCHGDDNAAISDRPSLKVAYHRQCVSCHQRLELKVGCTDCHQVHGAAVDHAQLRMEQPDLCYTCHGDVRGQFHQPSHHPVSEGMVSCTDCHLMSDDGMARLAIDGVRVLNLYVPNGSSLKSEKYPYKLEWLACLKRYLEVQEQQGDPGGID